MKFSRVVSAGMLMLVAACVPQRPSPPPQPAPQQPPQQPQPLPPPPPTAQDWRDRPVHPGQWVYGQQGDVTQALFGVPASEAVFLVRCDRRTRQVTLTRDGASTRAVMTIRTSYTARNLAATVQREPLGLTSATVSASDPILDSIAFSRGRFTVEAPGLQMLVIPSWPEPARVVEDCRR